jgi:hypothetical protein
MTKFVGRESRAGHLLALLADVRGAPPSAPRCIDERPLPLVMLEGSRAPSAGRRCSARRGWHPLAHRARQRDAARRRELFRSDCALPAIPPFERSGKDLGVPLT